MPIQQIEIIYELIDCWRCERGEERLARGPTRFSCLGTHLRIIPGVLSARWRFAVSHTAGAPLIQGWSRTASADRRFDASLTSSLVIKSLAASLMSRQSFSGKLKRPKIRKPVNKWHPNATPRDSHLHELTQTAALGIFGNSRRYSSRTLRRSCRKTADSQRVRYKRWLPSTTNHIFCRSCAHVHPQIGLLLPVPWTQPIQPGLGEEKIKIGLGRRHCVSVVISCAASRANFEMWVKLEEKVAHERPWEKSVHQVLSASETLYKVVDQPHVNIISELASTFETGWCHFRSSTLFANKATTASIGEPWSYLNLAGSVVTCSYLP